MRKRKTNKIVALLVIAMLISIFPQTAFAAPTVATTIVNLQADHLVNPVGIDSKTPAFSWQMDSNVIGARQTAYQVVVKDNADRVVWDSGKVSKEVSSNIKYKGGTLDAETRYSWTVKVTDERGNVITSSPAYFETGLLSKSKDGWDGAKWIGPDEFSFDATSSAYFDMSVDMTIPAGTSKAAVILGADDFRLQNEVYNIWRKAGENYFKFEVDVTTPDAIKLNVYVVGMPAYGQATENAADAPDFTYNIANSTIPEANIHEKMSIGINTLNNINQVACTINNIRVMNNVRLNPLGNSPDYNSFPNLNSIGFAVPAQGQAIYENFVIRNPGKYSTGILFDQTKGATYSIFSGLSGVTLNSTNGTITVAGGTGGRLIYADPSYGSAPMLRTSFTTSNDIASARLYATALGLYQMYINGKQVGEDDWFNPGNSEYREEVNYQTYDVTDMVKKGKNAIGAQLAEGWVSGYQTYTASNYNYYGDTQALMAKLVITYKNGDTKTIVTDDNTWDYYGNGPIEYASLYQGERYNAQTAKAMEGWSTYGYDLSGWQSATVIKPNKLMSNFKFGTSYDAPATVVKELTAQSVNETKPGSGTYIYDMGENVIGVPQVTLPVGAVSAGDDLILRFSEILYPDNLDEYTDAGIDGTLMVENYRAALSTDFYECTDGAQVVEPHYTYHGYRYLEISGLSQPLPKENVKTLVLSSVDMKATYDSSNTLVNRLFKNVQNSQTSNFLSLITDCPQRNERMGWLGDAQVFSLAATYNTDVYGIYREICKFLRQEQAANGGLPVTSPSFPTWNTETGAVTLQAGGGGISWSGAVCLMPYSMYQAYGDTQIIEENLDAMVKYLKFLDSTDLTVSGTPVDELTSNTGMLADWLSVVATDASLINNAVYVYLMGITSDMAQAAGKTAIATEYRNKFNAAKAKWNEVFIDSVTGKTKTAAGAIQDTQASYATPLRYNIISDAYVDRAVEHYVKTVTNPVVATVEPYTLTTGFSGTPNLVPVLTQYGYVEEAYKLFEQTQYASWLYPVVQGATSVWERWNSYTVENGFGGNNSMNSFNHFSLGAISEWIMAYQLGITVDSENPGYQKFILQPTPGGSFTYANGTFESNYGTIYSGWTASAGKLTSYKCTVPANSSATLYLPANTVGNFTNITGLTYEGMTERNGTQTAEFSVSSGAFEFDVSNAGVTARKGTDYIDRVEPPKVTPPAIKKPPTSTPTAVSIAPLKLTVADQAWTGKQVNPAVKLTLAGKTLVANTDYTIAYGANKNIGKGTLTITGKGKYSGTKAFAFKIVPKKISVTKIKAGKKQIKVTWKKLSAAQQVTKYQVQYRAKGTAKWKTKTVLAKSSSLTIKKLKKGKTYQVRVRAYKTVEQIDANMQIVNTNYYGAWSKAKISKKVK